MRFIRRASGTLELSNAEIVALLIVADKDGPNGRGCFQATRQMAEEWGRQRSTLNRALQSLVDKNVLLKEQRSGPQSNVYRLNLDMDMSAAIEEQDMFKMPSNAKPTGPMAGPLEAISNGPAASPEWSYGETALDAPQVHHGLTVSPKRTNNELQERSAERVSREQCVVDDWNSVTNGVLAPSSGSTRILMAARRAVAEHPNLDWRRLFRAIIDSPHHRGETRGRFKASLSWVLREDNLERMIELMDQPSSSMGGRVATKMRQYRERFTNQSIPSRLED